MDDNQNTRGQGHPKQPWGELKPQLSPRTRAVTCTDPIVIGESIINRSRPDGSSRIAPLFEQDGRISSHYHGLAAKKEDLQIGNDDDDDDDDDDDEDDDPFVETNKNMIMNKNEGSITAPANRKLVSAVATPFAAVHNDDEDKKNDTLSSAGHQTHLLDNNHHHHKGANSNAIMSSMARDLPTQSKQQQQQQHKQPTTTTTTTANTTVVSSTGSPQPKIPGRRRNQTMPTAATSPYRQHRRTNAISVARRFSLQQHLREHGQTQQMGEAQDDEDETKTDDDKDGENKTSSSPGSSSPRPSTSPMPAAAPALVPAPRRHASLPRSAPIDIASPKSPASKRANAEAMELKEAARRRDGGHNSTFSSSQSSPGGGGGGGEPMVVGDMSPWDTAARSPARK